MKATDLRPGLGIKIDGKLAVLTGVEHRTPGNLRAFIQIKYKEVLSGKTLEKRLGSSDDLEVVDLDRRPMEYLYSDSSGATFMDKENYEQLSLPADFLEGQAGYLLPNTDVQINFYNSRPIGIELPPSVVLTVSDTEPGIKNSTATNSFKPATMETGITVQVPPFINKGERIKVDTAEGTYMERA